MNQMRNPQPRTNYLQITTKALLTMLMLPVGALAGLFVSAVIAVVFAFLFIAVTLVAPFVVAQKAIAWLKEKFQIEQAEQSIQQQLILSIIPITMLGLVISPLVMPLAAGLGVVVTAIVTPVVFVILTAVAAWTAQDFVYSKCASFFQEAYGFSNIITRYINNTGPDDIPEHEQFYREQEEQQEEQREEQRLESLGKETEPPYQPPRGRFLGEKDSGLRHRTAATPPAEEERNHFNSK